MTSRLKRKLGEIGVDTSSRKANENFCLIGTPLPPLEKSKDTGEFVPLWKQEVRDEKGRRRLHGAFTGGWSAGHFNTVGSKEGWAPSTFVSSRNERAKKQAARPEDFMDDEDLQDLKDSQNLVDTTEQMDFMGGTQVELHGKVELDDSEKDPITRTLEANLLPTPKDSVGAKILKKMGWRLGQGIGPRITLKRRKEQDAEAYDPSTGNRVTFGNLDIAEDDEEAGKHTYASRDTPVLVVRRKDNTHGLGYVPGMSLEESLGNSGAGGSSGSRLAGGFGLGALNDADEDDLDVYDTGNQQKSRRRLAYDHMDGDDDDTVVIGSRMDQHKRSTHAANPSTGHFRDGRQVLVGFVLSEGPVAEDKWFPLPEIPSTWKPDPKRVWAKDKENTQAPQAALSRTLEAQPHAKWKKSSITADQRGALLGETPLPSGPKSIFDYMSEKDKERIQRIAFNLTSGQDSSSGTSTNASRVPGTSGFLPAPPSSITRVEPQVAQAALRGFQPFTSDPAKQARYTAFLQSQADADGSVPPLIALPTQQPEDLRKELEDYAKAASLFKPMSGAMAGRFTSAAVLDMGPKVVEGLYQPSIAEIEEKERRKKEEEEEKARKIDPKIHAAKMGMYGPMTREVKVWVPVRLLCKRFGVKEPDVAGAADTDVDEVKGREAQAASGSSFTNPEFGAAASSSGSISKTADVTVPLQKPQGPRDITNVGLGDDETQGQDTLTYQRPSMDIFKAIFASDAEDDDEDDEPDKMDEEVLNDTATTTTTKPFTNATVILDDTPVDPNIFKPTFIPREGKAKKSKKGEKSKEKKEKKKGVLVSFEMEEDGTEVAAPKKKKKKRKEEVIDGDEMLVYKPPADLPPFVGVVDSMTTSGAQDSGAAVNRGRKRAVDFMD